MTKTIVFVKPSHYVYVDSDHRIIQIIIYSIYLNKKRYWISY